MFDKRRESGKATQHTNQIKDSLLSVQDTNKYCWQFDWYYVGQESMIQMHISEPLLDWWQFLTITYKWSNLYKAKGHMMWFSFCTVMLIEIYHLNDWLVLKEYSTSLLSVKKQAELWFRFQKLANTESFQMHLKVISRIIHCHWTEIYYLVLWCQCTLRLIKLCAIIAHNNCM